MTSMKLLINLFTYSSFGLLIVAALNNKPAENSAHVIRIDGSSTVFPIVESASFEFQKSNLQKITVGVSGTGGGFKKFCDGKVDIANASRPIQKSEIEKCSAKGIRFFEVPVAYDALVVAVNKANALREITLSELKKMWEPEAKDKMLNWKDVNPLWEKQPLKLYGAGTDSGTFDYFTETVVGKSKSSRPDYTSSEDDNILVTGVSLDKGALAYFGYAYFEQNKDKLKALSIFNEDIKSYIEPSTSTVLNKTYPLARPLFMYVSEKALLDRPEIKKFISFILENGKSITEKARYIPLPSLEYKNTKQKIDGLNIFAANQ